jgi:hypothetical protein
MVKVHRKSQQLTARYFSATPEILCSELKPGVNNRCQETCHCPFKNGKFCTLDFIQKIKD